MRENRTYGSEGGAAQAVPTPIHSTGLLWVRPVVGRFEISQTLAKGVRA